MRLRPLHVLVALCPLCLLTACGGAPRWNDAEVVAAATGGEFTATAGKIADATCGEPLDYDARVVDLNQDGRPEVFINVYGSCWGGGAGVHMNLFIKGADGTWVPQFGFPGVAKILDTGDLGYPDIEIGGPGSCFPIWRWTGQIYELYRKCPG